jgi:cytosine/uracil/thiamine/allantoin permease
MLTNERTNLVHQVTCFRKFLSIVFSFFIFSKVATINHVAGGVLCFAGIAMQIWIKQQNRLQRATTEPPSKKRLR